MDRIFSFLSDLRDNNNRAWFADNKPRYLGVKADIETLTLCLLAELSQIDPEAARLSPADCLYRIYRDTRFSADKTPYKTHIGIFMNPPLGKKAMTAGYYLHLEPGNTFFAAGTVCLPSPTIRALRQAIFDNFDEYAAIVDDPAFRKLFPNVGDNLLKTTPKGFPKDWPHIAYLRPRDYIAWTAPLPIDPTVSAEAVTDFPAVATLLRPFLEQARRFNTFLNFTLDDSEQ